MKVAIICYHKNAQQLYPAEWIAKYKYTIDNQDYKDVTILECCYGGESYQIFPQSQFEYIEMPTFVHAMNHLIDKAFADGFEAVANTNVDDFYTMDRISRQIPYIMAGFDIVASNFTLVGEGTKAHQHRFHHMVARIELARNNNIIGHPVVMYSPKFWQKHRYKPEEIPLEDMKLWQRAISNCRFTILPFNLLFHRLHNNAVSRPQQNYCIR